MANEILSFFDDQYFADVVSTDLVNPENIDKTNQHQTTSSESDDTGNSKSFSMIVHPVEINQSFPKQPASEHLRSILEYRVKLQVPQNIVFQKGLHGTAEMFVIMTNCSHGSF